MTFSNLHFYGSKMNEHLSFQLYSMQSLYYMLDKHFKYFINTYINALLLQQMCCGTLSLFSLGVSKSTLSDMFLYICISSFVTFPLLHFSSLAQSCPTLCDPIDCSTPGFPVHHQLPELAQTHVHQVGDAIQPSHPSSSPSPLTFNLSQH